MKITMNDNATNLLIEDIMEKLNDERITLEQLTFIDDQLSYFINPNNPIDISIDRDTILDIGKPTKPGGRHNGFMPTLLLAPYRLYAPAILGLGILTIFIIRMFAG